MYTPLQFSDEIEQQVRWVEDTDPGAIIEQTLNRLRDGLGARDVLRAAALALVRSTELPASHHGGAVHPINGLRGCFKTSERLSGELSYLPLIQHVALCNHHIHSPHMGPYIMPELEPMDGSIDAAYETFHDIESSIIHMGKSTADTDNGRGSREATLKAFMNNLHLQRPVAAEQCCLWLIDRESPETVLDAMLPTMVARNHMDDHYFLYPMLNARALDCIGREWSRVLMRPVVRYQARNAIDLSDGASFQFSQIEDALKEFRLLDIELPEQTGDHETEAIGELGSQIGSTKPFSKHIELIAKALANGLSLQGAGEALSIGVSTIFENSSYGNPMDAHLHTGVNTRRYLLGLTGVSRRNKLLSLLSGITGPECTISESMLDSVGSEPPANKSQRTEAELIEAITECIEGQPQADWRASHAVHELPLAPEAKTAMAMARRYANEGHDPMRLFARLGELVARDDFTELHTIKQHQAMVDEFNTTREAFRTVHLVAAAKSASVARAGREQTVYDSVRELLH